MTATLNHTRRSRTPVSAPPGGGLDDGPICGGAAAPANRPPQLQVGPRISLVEVAVPVYNEEAVLEPSVRTLDSYLARNLPYPYRITIADNASTDATWQLACRLAGELPAVEAIHLDLKGRGRALKAVWGASTADVVAYTDVDLSTGLDALLPLIAPLVSGHSDIAIGSRLATGARVVRGLKREVISRCYNMILRTATGARFTDAQCGFKAGRRDVVQALLPAIENENWFFDSELLLLAEESGLRIHEVPVDWVDDADSRVALLATAIEDLQGIRRVRRRIAEGSFAVIVPANPRQFGSAARRPQPEVASGAGLVAAR